MSSQIIVSFASPWQAAWSHTGSSGTGKGKGRWCLGSPASSAVTEPSVITSARATRSAGRQLRRGGGAGQSHSGVLRLYALLRTGRVDPYRRRHVQDRRPAVYEVNSGGIASKV
jgi:hypothetical protein